MNNEQLAAYAFAKTESWLERFSSDKQLDAGDLIARVGQWLCTRASGARPSELPTKPRGKSSYWNKMTAAERSAEIRRRMAVREKKATQRTTTAHQLKMVQRYGADFYQLTPAERKKRRDKIGRDNQYPMGGVA